MGSNDRLRRVGETSRINLVNDALLPPKRMRVFHVFVRHPGCRRPAAGENRSDQGAQDFGEDRN